MNFLKGIFFALSSIPYVFMSGLKRYIVLPLLFNFIVFLCLVYFLYHYLAPYSAYYVEKLPSWLHFLQWFFVFIFILSFFLLFLSVFTILFNLIAAPFNGLLAEKAQKLIYGLPIPPISFGTMVLRSLKRQAQFLGYFVPRFLGMILLFFVPFIHPFYPLLWFLFNAWMLSMQYQDFAFDNNLVSFKTMKAKMQEDRMVSLGFGAFINFVSFVPILNLLVMPAAVIGGVVLYCEEKGLAAKNGRILLKHR